MRSAIRLLAVGGVFAIAGGASVATAAVVPGGETPCRLGIEVAVRADLTWRDADWRVFMEEAARPWTMQGVDLCWISGGGALACGSGISTLFVALAPDTPAGPRGGHGPLGWLGFSGERGPGSFAVLSVRTARRLVAQTTVGSRPLWSWPARAVEALLPRALGRALAHEIGHYLLRTREHAARGLMRASFRPEDLVAPRPGSRFDLLPAHRPRVLHACRGGVSADVAATAPRPGR
jgi:hypothetical protein